MNKYIFFFILFFNSSLITHHSSFLHAQEGNQAKFFVINDFSKGLRSHLSPFNTPDNAASDTQNVRFNRVFGAVSKRPIMLQSYDFGSDSITGLHRYYKSNGLSLTIAATGTTLQIGNDDDGTGTIIRDNLTEGRRWQFITFKDILIGGNGFDNNIKYDGLRLTTADTDGARTVDNLAADLGAPFAELNNGSNLEASKWYQYKIAYNVIGISHFSNARSNAILTGATVRDIRLVDVPIGIQGTTSRKIYRTTGQFSRIDVENLDDSQFFLVGTLNNNIDKEFDDKITDAVAVTKTTFQGDNAGGINVTPEKTKYFLIHDERLFSAGDIAFPSRLYFSDLLNPDFFDIQAFFRIRPDDGDEITFLKNLLGILTVGKTNTIQKLFVQGSGTDLESILANWSVSDPFSHIGCPAPYSVADSTKGIVYLGRHGLYLFNGQSSQLVSDVVTDKIKDISATRIQETAGIFHDNQYQLAYTSFEGGNVINDKVLIFDFIRNAYTLDNKNINVFAKFEAGIDQGTLISGSSSNDGLVFTHERGVPVLSKGFKDEFDAGTYDDTNSFGIDKELSIELAWDITIDEAIGTIDSQVGIIDRPDTDGTWLSPVYQINAATLASLSWNEFLGGTGNVTWAIRTGDTIPNTLAAAFSAEFTSPIGSDVSGVTADDFIQLRASLSTSDINFTPKLIVASGFIFKLVYAKSSSLNESSVLSTWISGWENFGVPGFGKNIRRIKVFYRGTTGTLNFAYKSSRGDTDSNFDIDMSVNPSTLPTTLPEDEFEGTDDNKIFIYLPPFGEGPIGEFWQFTIIEDSTEDFTVERVQIAYTLEEIPDI